MLAAAGGAGGGAGFLMPQSERYAAALRAFLVSLDELYRAREAERSDEPDPPAPSRWQHVSQHLPLYIGIPVIIAVLLMISFVTGRDYQKEHGPPGNECKAGEMLP